MAEIDAELADVEFYAKPQNHVVERTQQRGELAKEVARLYARWEKLEALK